MPLERWSDLRPPKRVDLLTETMRDWQAALSLPDGERALELLARFVDSSSPLEHRGEVLVRERLPPENELDSGLLWPKPIVQLNPSFQAGEWIDDLVAGGVLHEEARRVFKLGKAEGRRHPFAYTGTRRMRSGRLELVSATS